MSEIDDPLPRLLGGRYRLEAKLGSGGMGIVYRATDLTMKRPVAVKLIRGVDGVALDEEVAGRFLREAKNTARIQHENIIDVYDLGHGDEGDMYFVMELLEGESLSTKLRREGKIPPKVTVHIARQLCAALHVAHGAGIIHRDLKPANVMLVRRGNDANYVKVLDFGVAKSYTLDQQTQLTHTGMLVGTVDYMAPEQIMGRTVDGRTDLYALGVVMYRMLTGKPPFRDGGVPALIHAHLNVYPQPMSETNNEISGELDRVVLRSLAKQPEQRYESMEELSRALAAAIDTTHDLIPRAYDAEEVYGASEETAFARRQQVAPGPVLASVASEDSFAAAADSFDDATIRIDRPDRAAVPRGIARIASPLEDSDRTAIMVREEPPTAKRPIPDAVTRADSAPPRECAMCRTMNAPHARSCSACGVSLACEDQEAVRARVTAPRTTHLAGPQLPPGTPVSYVQPQQSFMPQAPAPVIQAPARAMQGMQGPHAQHVAQFQHAPQLQPSTHAPNSRPTYPSVNWQNNPAAPTPQSPSAWQRFLWWTGLR